MATYRVSRNIEATIIEFIEAELASGGWTGISVEKGYARIYDIDLPSICVRLEVSDHDKVEIGDTSTVRTAMVMIDLFCKNDGQRLDLKDFLVSVLKSGMTFYDFVTTTSGRTSSVDSRTANGTLHILNIEDTPIDFETPKSEEDVHDRYRHRLVLTCTKGQVEA